MNTVDIFFNQRTGLTQFCNQRLLVFRQYVFNNYVAAGHCRRNHVSACLNAVGNNGMLYAVQLGYAFNGNNVCTGAAHTRTHLVKIVGKVYNFRFFGRVFQNRGTVCHCCRHHNIFGCAHTRKIEVNIGTRHAFWRRSLNIAMALFNFNAQCFKAF